MLNNRCTVLFYDLVGDGRCPRLLHFTLFIPYLLVGLS